MSAGQTGDGRTEESVGAFFSYYFNIIFIIWTSIINHHKLHNYIAGKNNLYTHKTSHKW